jgi:putative Ca2+/H+ antiporter (TMEM165/GDT1 family)
MKTSRLISFTGSMAALTVMTILSVLIGQVGKIEIDRAANERPTPLAGARGRNHDRARHF